MDVQNILLQITGSSGDARRDLQQTAAELAAFDQIDAEAELDVDTAIAKAKIASLKRDIATLSDITLDVDADTGLARAQIMALNAELEVQEQVVKRAGDAMSAASEGAGGFGFNVAGLTGKIGPATLAAAALAIAVGVSLVGALTALVASLTAAVGGLAALGVAFGATLLPAIALGIGAIQRFKDQADTAGTPANRLKRAAEQLGQTFSRTLGPAADAVFDGLAGAMRQLEPVLGRLRPAFTQFGQAVGRAFSAIGRELSSPAWSQFFNQLIGSTSRIVGPLTQSFLALARILRNIASAAMPFLVSGLRSMARGLQGLAAGTSNAKELRGTIGGLVDHLRSWLNLGKQVGSVILGFFKAAAPAGKGLVDQLAQGAQKLAEWANSAEGQERIKQFFERVVPLAKQIVGLAGDLLVAFIAFGEAAAPILTPIVESIRDLVKGLSRLLGLIAPVTDGLSQLTGSFNPAELFINPAGAVNKWTGQLMSGLESTKAQIRPFGSALGQTLAAGLASASGASRSAGRQLAIQAAAAAATAKGQLMMVGGQLGKGLAEALGAKKPDVTAAGRGAGKAAHDGARSQANPFRGVGGLFGSNLAAGVGSKVGEARSRGQGLGQGAVQGAARGGQQANSVGSAIGEGFNSGLSGWLGAIVDTAVNIVRAAMDAARRQAKTGSPSRVSMDIGSDIGEGFALGIASQMRSVVAAMEGVTVGAMVPAQALAGVGSGSSGSISQAYHTTVQPLAGGGSPDPDLLLAQLDAKIRARGGLS